MKNTPSDDYYARFGGIARLYGTRQLDALFDAHMVVVGLGGVGSWTAEALARSGIGQITLIDLDDICTTNTNRQIHATQSSVGKTKAEVLASRLKDINPDIAVNVIFDFLDTKNIAQYITPEHDVVIDAIDSVNVKSGLASYCSARKIRLIIVGSSGGKKDPTQIKIDDLARTKSDPMLAKLRQQLFRIYKFSREKNRKFRIDAIYSTEQMVYPQADGSVCMEKQFKDGATKLDCSGGFGSASMVTGAFGFTAATRAIERYLAKVEAIK